MCLPQRLKCPQSQFSSATLRCGSCVLLPETMDYAERCNARCASERRFSSTSLIQTYLKVILLLYVSFTENVRGEPKKNQMSSPQCNGKDPCDHPFRWGQFSMPPDQIFRQRHKKSAAPQTTSGFDPNEPCPTTELFNSGVDLRSVENQVN
jgi:hypothetical protein